MDGYAVIRHLVLVNACDLWGVIKSLANKQASVWGRNSTICCVQVLHLTMAGMELSGNGLLPGIHFHSLLLVFYEGALKGSISMSISDSLSWQIHAAQQLVPAWV